MFLAGALRLPDEHGRITTLTTTRTSSLKEFQIDLLTGVDPDSNNHTMFVRDDSSQKWSHLVDDDRVHYCLDAILRICQDYVSEKEQNGNNLIYERIQNRFVE